MGDVQYRGDIMINMGDVLSTVGVFSTVGDIMSTVVGYLEYSGDTHPTVLHTPTVLHIRYTG